MNAIRVGAELPSERRTATLETLVRYAGAAGDFYPMHYDLDAAHRQGHDELSLHGLLKAAWLHDYVAAWAEGVADVEEIDVRYQAMDFRDRPLTLSGRVEVIDGARIELTLWTRDDTGAVTTTGTARLLTHPHPPATTPHDEESR